jgi:hypothetical protein
MASIARPWLGIHPWAHWIADQREPRDGHSNLTTSRERRRYRSRNLHRLKSNVTAIVLSKRLKRGS